MARHAIAIALPRGEREPVAASLREGGLEPIFVERPAQLAALLTDRDDVTIAVLDGETDFDESLEYYAELHAAGRDIPALMVLSPRTLDRISGRGGAASAKDEYLTRPYPPESLRWRIEAMLIRRMTVDDGSGAAIQGGPLAPEAWGRRAALVAVFNPKGGVGKTTISINLAATLTAMDRAVLLVDADTVTGHVTTSLGLEHVRTLIDAVLDAGPDGHAPDTIDELVAAHPSGLRVLSLSSSPLRTSLLDPNAVADAIESARSGYDVILVDLHPDYDRLNRAMFDRVDRILVPVTPDVPCLRAAVQLRDVALELGFRDKLAMIVNRANSGVSVPDMERTVGLPAFASIRSAGLQLVAAANAGKTVIDLYPREGITEDFRSLADRVLGVPRPPKVPSRLSLRTIFGRRSAARAA